MHLIFRITILLFAFLATTFLAQAREVFLVRDGKSASVILVSKEPEESAAARAQKATVEGAAKDLQSYLRRMSGAEVPIRAVSPQEFSQVLRETQDAGQTVIALGAVATPLLANDATAQEALKTPDAFALKVESSLIAIAGGNARGTEIGVHALLEQFGVRWFFPGELGTVIPDKPTLAIRVQKTVEKPSFAARQFQIQDANEWVKFQRTGGRYFTGAHGIRFPSGITFETHPQLYALVKGKRARPQICLSNPETLRYAVDQAKTYFAANPKADWYGMGPEDKSGFCECDGCRAMDGGDYDPFSGEPSMTDRYISFFNRVLAELETDYPDRKIAFYIYHTYMRPPVRVKPHPNIVGALAPIALCRIHGMSNPVCPERSYLYPLTEAWTKQLSEVYERGYWFNLADPGMWFLQTSRLKDEIGAYHKMGVRGFRTECLGHWAVEGPSLYIAGRLMWNADADTDALLDDYCEKLFGPAAKPMKAYFKLIDDRLREGDHHAGSAFDITRSFPVKTRQQMNQHIHEAMALAKAAPQSERVAIFARGHAYANAFAEMLEAEDRQDWKGAYESLQKMDLLRDELVEGNDSPMLGRRSAASFLKRFFRLPVEQGWKRSSQNLGFVPLSNQWSFLTDPQGVGEALGYWRAGEIGGSWQEITSTGQTWSDAGLRYYKGIAWYRQEVELPAELTGKRVFLWFGGVDESARVWVNGQLLGNSPRSAFTPFELDATSALRPGKNTVAVCVANLRVDELGTGGITAPAFLYAPTAGDAAQLENVKALQETFP